MEDSPSSFTRPSWAVLCTWVPPHSSLEKSPMVTTRTRSPYFSPNSAMAPCFLASSMLMTSAVTSSSRARISLIFCSTSLRTVPGTAVGEPKSKRKRPGAFSEPAWAAVGPSASRSAWWVRWVALWARAMARRRLTSMTAYAEAPTVTSPTWTVPLCTVTPGTGCWTSRTSTTAPLSRRMRPVSGCCPPPSA